MLSLMKWNWQLHDWPQFRFQSERLAEREAVYLRRSGVVLGTVRHLDEDDRTHLVVELMSTEALKTAEIEGEVLDRPSVQSSLRRQFGLQTDARRVPPSEQGVAEMLTSLYQDFAAPLTAEPLFAWHRMLMQGRPNLTVGAWRSGGDPMQIVSGPIHAPKVHFQAPPAARVPDEMDAFCEWFNATAPGAEHALSALARAGIAHLYFESIHPFEDGNGRIGRAIAEKALAQAAAQPALSTLSLTLSQHRARYYRELELASAGLDVDDWLDWFADIALEAQQHMLNWLEFLVAKSHLLDRLRGRLNARQEKALLRMMRDGPAGFEGGLSAGKYSAITGTSPATATRDLAELVALGALRRTGQLRGARYWLAFEPV